MSGTPDLAVVVVTWNVRDLMLGCLSSVEDEFARMGLSGAIWVVDNASSDGTADAIRREFSGVNLLEPGQNLGFARGNNLALRAIGFPDGDLLPPYVLLLNPDTIVRPDAFRELIAGLERSGAGLAGARLVYRDGSFQHSAFAFPGLAQLVFDLFPVPGRLLDSRLNGRYPRRHYEGAQPFDADHPLGASFLLRGEVIPRVGMFDEQFHLYCEEIDWAMRIKRAGWRVVCVPQAEIIHSGGQSTTQVKPASLINLWTARLLYYRKHYSAVKRAAAGVILRAGMERLIQQTARNSALSEDERKALVDACQEIIRLTRKV